LVGVREETHPVVAEIFRVVVDGLVDLQRLEVVSLKAREFPEQDVLSHRAGDVLRVADGGVRVGAGHLDGGRKDV
jgi:hypothetical protein